METLKTIKKFSQEVSEKIAFVQNTLKEAGMAAAHLRGTDWFAWATAGGENTVLLAAETGVAEVLITGNGAWILTDEIESQRFIDEELPTNFELFINPWAEIGKRESFVRDVTEGGKIASDRPLNGESPLPVQLMARKRVMTSSEIERYRQVGRQASEAMTEVLSQAKPTWTEYQLAGAGAEALWARGLHPTLTLVAGERRLPLYRHATATGEVLGREAMLVFCARGYGLYANLTRFVCFGQLDGDRAQLHQQVREVEAECLNLCHAGTSLNTVYQALAQAYEQRGFPKAIYEHHQGGTTGYLSREVVANPTTADALARQMAVAWNPSLPGAKIEDTFLLQSDGGLENLTFDPQWPSVEVAGRSRPIPLEIA